MRRATLAELLAGQLPAGTVRYATTVTAVQPGESAAVASVHTADGSHQAELIVAGDGIRSALRSDMLPGAPSHATPATPHGG